MQARYCVLILSLLIAPAFSKSAPDSVENVIAFFGHLRKELQRDKPTVQFTKRKIELDRSSCPMPDSNNGFEITQDSAIHYMQENFEGYALSQIWFHHSDSVVVSFWPKNPGFFRQKAFEAVRHENNGSVHKINPGEAYGTGAGIGIHLIRKRGKYRITKISYSESC